MFKMNFSGVSPSRVSSSTGQAPLAQKNVAFHSAIAPQGSRGVARMGMDIANLRTSRGCNSCGK